MAKSTYYSAKKCEECEAFIASHGLIEYGGAKLKDYCEQMGFNEKTHRNWKKRYKDYVAAIERGLEKYRNTHTRKLFGTLMEAAVGGERTVTEEHTEYRPDPAHPENAVIRKQVRNKKTIYVQPNVVAAIFLLCNLDPEHFKNRQQNDISIKKPETEEELTPEEIKAEIERLKMFPTKE